MESLKYNSRIMFSVLVRMVYLLGNPQWIMNALLHSQKPYTIIIIIIIIMVCI